MLVVWHGSITVSVKVDWQGGVGALQGQLLELSKVAVTDIGKEPAFATSLEYTDNEIEAPGVAVTIVEVVELVSV